MNIEEFKSLQIGDRIEFRSVTRFNSRKAVRKITGFPKVFENLSTWGERSTDWIHVRFEGTPNFMVKRSEVIRRVD